MQSITHTLDWATLTDVTPISIPQLVADQIHQISKRYGANDCTSLLTVQDKGMINLMHATELQHPVSSDLPRGNLVARGVRTG